MNKEALEKCHSRLRIASKAIRDLSAARNPEDFTDSWTIFLTAWKSIYNQLEQGTKADASERQWFGAKKAQRKNDTLLSYLFAARNDDEHGLQKVLKMEQGREVLFDLGPDSQKGIMLVDDPVNSGMMAVNSEGTPLKILAENRHPMKLKPVFGRGNVYYHPPVAHDGQTLPELGPIAVATAGVQALSKIVAEIEAMQKT